MPLMCYRVENMGRIRPEIVQQRIKFFERRFGKAHLFLAYHAAFPLALTPDLLYRLWANFQLDINGRILNIPWIAVSDLLLSSLCHEVGHELYEIDLAVRNELLKQLKGDEKFGLHRINELSDFLLAYVNQQLYSDDPDIQNFAQTQRWTALAYTRPNEVARELALTFSQLKESDSLNIIQVASLTNTLAEPLAQFQPLLTYGCAMEQFARGNLESASSQLDSLLTTEKKICVEGVNLPIPKQLKANLKQIKFSWNIYLKKLISITICTILFITLFFITFVALSPETFGGYQAPLAQVCKYITSFIFGLISFDICSKSFNKSGGFVKNWKSYVIGFTLIILSVTSFVALSPQEFGGDSAPFVEICKYITSAGLAAIGVYGFKDFNISRVFVNNWGINTFAVILSVTSFVALSPQTFGGNSAPFVEICKYITSAGLAALGIGFWIKRNF